MDTIEKLTKKKNTVEKKNKVDKFDGFIFIIFRKDKARVIFGHV